MKENNRKYVYFGSYPQESDGAILPIKWRVLASSEDKVLLISEYALETMEYHNEFEHTTWEKSTIRNWLNTHFLDTAFTKEEQELIWSTDVHTQANPDYATNPGKDTYDKVFLLSAEEAKLYFASDEDRGCKPTPYAQKKNAYQNTLSGNCWWWIRTPGHRNSYAAFIRDVGSVFTYGGCVINFRRNVRPALWIDISKAEED